MRKRQIVEYSNLSGARHGSMQSQRSRVQWLKEGDANTKFFHQSTLHRRRRYKVVSLKNSQGNWIENPFQIRRLFDEYFMELFTSSGQREWGSLLDCVSPKISDEMNESLLAVVSNDEVRAAAMQMGSLKAPGPYGFPGIFYQNNWDTVATEVNELIWDLMNGTDIPWGINATHLVLIPKVHKPESVEQFRPISLGNFSYKVLSKVLANRLKVVLPDLISPSQNAFVAERQIQDNIGIAHELFHFLKTRNARSQFELGIKLDMQKAYDRVEWDFLMAVMEKMGFEESWRKLILGCISSVNFAILLNGQLGSKFAPSRGLRQGDPLSPYLFLLAEEVHCRNLIRLIDNFCEASGQHVNKSKSSVCFGSNVLEEVSRHLSNILGFERVGDLGMESLGRPKKEGGLGLRSFSRFNDALLAKQCWRLISEPNTLWALVLKARYFPNCSFLDAKKGGRASWIWSSLLAGREIMREGAHWQIMDGNDTRVKSLICPVSGDWDLDFLKPFLAESEVEAILDLHTGDPTLKDRLVWPYDKKGSYSVKSGYYWSLNRNIDHSQQSIRLVSIPSTLWKTVWKLKVIWFGGMLNLRPLRQHVSSWANWLVQMGEAENESAEGMINRISYIAFTCWHIWKSRCEFQFNNQVVYPSRVVAAVSRSEARLGVGFTGVVAKDEHGRFLAAFRHKIKATGATMAEALAIIHECNLGGNWDAFPILRKCLRLGGAFQDCHWSWVPRLANLVADCLALCNCKEVCDQIWVNRPPSSLVHVLCNDGLPCPP
ncbi:hypothetical protein PS2_026450 [Malus domestica]